MPGGSVLHANAIRVRVVGNGNFRCTFQGFDNVYTQVLIPIVMVYPEPRLKTRLSNFQSQAVKLRMETTAIGEIMRVNDLTIFVKPLWVDYPA